MHNTTRAAGSTELQQQPCSNWLWWLPCWLSPVYVIHDTVTCHDHNLTSKLLVMASSVFLSSSCTAQLMTPAVPSLPTTHIMHPSYSQLQYVSQQWLTGGNRPQCTAQLMMQTVPSLRLCIYTPASCSTSASDGLLLVTARTLQLS
jgi:hypothetical protein